MRNTKIHYTGPNIKFAIAIYCNQRGYFKRGDVTSDPKKATCGNCIRKIAAQER